jgi:primosomal protein N'
MTRSPWLFPDQADPDELDDSSGESAPAIPAEGPFAGVALDQSIDRVLDYSVPKALQHTIQVGQRVVVPLGRRNKPTRGYVVSIQPTTDHPKVKPLRAIDDERVLVDGKLLELARWMSRYYCAPLGAVIESIVPSAVKKKIGVGYAQIVRPAKPREELQSLLEKTKAPEAPSGDGAVAPARRGDRRSSWFAWPARRAPRRPPSARWRGWGSS